MNPIVDILMFLLGLYCVLESVAAAMLMHNGDRFCRWMKYLLTGVSGAYAIWLGWKHYALPQDLFWAMTIALFVWPKMLARIQDWLKAWQQWRMLKSMDTR